MSINFEKICNNLSLGNIIENAEKINGGITNQMYKIQTTKGKFAVKIINKHRIQKNKNILKKSASPNPANPKKGRVNLLILI